MNMLRNKNRKYCCGCGTCANSCPQNCINMLPDSEGFLYPQVEESLCIGCHNCEHVCPILNERKEETSYQEGYIIQNSNLSERKSATSGGFFSVLCKYVISNEGIVYGVKFDKRFKAIHAGITDIKDISVLCRSKYVQSETGFVFREVKNNLDKGKLVCFSGTPCQIEGLKLYLKKEYYNLITCDVVCRGVPSPLFWEKYKDYIKGCYGTPAYVGFREKTYGYSYSTLVFRDKDGGLLYSAGVESDPYLRAFFSDISVRPSCFHCKFKKRFRQSDYTIWDCFPVYKFSTEMDDDFGTTRLIIHTDKGQEVFDSIKPELNYKRIEVQKLISDSVEMTASVIPNPRREAFFKDFITMEFEDVLKKYFPDSIKVKIERTARILFIKIGIYRRALRVYKRFANSKINRYRSTKKS